MALGLMALFFSATFSYGQYSTAEETIEYINDRLSHSFIQKIGKDGMVTINAPDQKILFRIQEASFNYNGQNHDDRVRVFCEDCIQHFEHKQLTETTGRQSFLCESEKEANEVINAFKYLKKIYSGGQTALIPADKKLKISDTTLGYKTVNEAIDFINDNLTHSMVTRIDDQGIMVINAPDETYRVNLKKAEFGYNDSDGTRVRIYGDFCLEEVEHGKRHNVISRQSFSAASRFKAYKVITALYYLKSAYSDLDPAMVPGLTNVSRNFTSNYTNIQEAIDFINERLSYSIVMNVDNQGNISINSPDDIYRFNLRDVEIYKAIRKKSGIDWFNVVINDGSLNGVMFECDECIKKYDDPDSYDTMDEQVFQCETSSEVKEVVKAFSYIQANIKK